MAVNFRVVDSLITLALEEDLPWGDITTESLFKPEQIGGLAIILEEEGIVAGLAIAQRVFQKIDQELIWTQETDDGRWLKKGTVLATIRGSLPSLLKGERLALNFLQRLSGIATTTLSFVTAAKRGSSTVKVVDTRKTTPGLRYLEKYAVKVGGGYNHRYSLSDSVLIKDNHIAALKDGGYSLTEAIVKIREKTPHTVRIGVEAEKIEQITDILKAGVDAILLDNMTNEELKEAVSMINGRVLVEASGGVSLSSIAKIAQTGVDIISVGALTHSAPALNIGMDYL
jgi:nicotinate-nucleotide pyrophosphorylase (carboxylating)